MLTDEFIPFDQAMSGPPPIFLAFFGIVAAIVVAGFAFVVVKGVSQWRANEASPLRSVDALVVSRRTDVRRRSGSTALPGADPGAPMVGGTPATSSTTYFVTFEEPSGERRELQVSGHDFGQLAEGDRGHLMHQGTRYKGFTRQGALDGSQ
ncbi:hypothetical protein GCM10009721_37070 [Terrabacter tumescens]|uniref:DUF2500 domain-containing protein n=1 Tax=Terrabacter tumescens TaxID=60443 RepID=A0ABQ2ICS4_9MICO|nr:DUF2500 domain-containing protein [Terrabacter tumescens]GGN06121.1 hypothetical protein GCM10009721_37070 [Terrabacter tumescens]